jgi:hypothetical protein
MFISGGFEILTAAGKNAAIVWDIAPCIPKVNRDFGGTYHLNLQYRKSARKEPACTYTAPYLRRRQHSVISLPLPLSTHQWTCWLWPNL